MINSAHDAVRDWMYDLKKHNNDNGIITIVPGCDEFDDNCTYYGEIGAERIEKVKDFLLNKKNWTNKISTKDFGDEIIEFTLKGTDIKLKFHAGGRIVEFEQKYFEELKKLVMEKF